MSSAAEAVSFTIQQAVRVIASRGVFTGKDAHFGKTLAVLDDDKWSEKMLAAAHRMLATYRTPLAVAGIEYDAILSPEAEQRKLVAARVTQAPAAHKYRAKIVRQEPKNRWLLEFPFDQMLVNALKKLNLKAQATYEADGSARWYWPVYQEKILEVLPLIQGFEGATDVMAGVAESEIASEANRRGSGAAVATRDVSLVSRSGKRSRTYQEAGVEYMLRTERCICADQMGLGKSVVAAMVLAHAKPGRSLVIVPASLKLNWRNELEEWVPGASVEVINARDLRFDGHARIFVINYDLIGEWRYRLGNELLTIKEVKDRDVDKKRTKKMMVLTPAAAAIKAMGIDAIVLDEIHMCKHSTSLRSKAAKELARDVPLRIGLTGTPVENRPKELAHQLEIIGRINDFGGWKAFTKKYCGGHQGAFGWVADGATNSTELCLRLRKTCYVRRLKDEVLGELPPKVYARVPIPLSNEAEYRSAEADYLSWVMENEGSEKAARASKAEELTRLNGLMKIAARGKIRGIKEWVEGFLESGEKLVLFAHHIEVQQAFLAIHRDAVAIRGGETNETLEAAKKLFFGPAQLIVCSIKAGGVGHTLHADGRCSSVALAEFPWSPAQQEQCEDRVHRYGQTAESVNVWELYAPGTVDEDRLALLGEKRRVIDAVTDGAERDRLAVQSVEGDLIERMKERAREARGKPTMRPLPADPIEDEDDGEDSEDEGD